MRAAIVVPVISQLVEETRAAIAAMNEADALTAAFEKKLGEQREILKARRIEVGMLLKKARQVLPARGTRENGWGQFLEAVEMSESTAYKYLQEAGWVSGRSLSPRHGDSEISDVYAPPPSDVDAPPESVIEADADVGSAERARERGLRDGWCTPEPITKALPKKLDLDPCSNERSLVIARVTYVLERGEDGLVLPWFGLVFANIPYSAPLPWAEKLERERANVKGAGFLVNADNSPAWWHVLTKHLHLRLDLNERQEFIPPPGVEPSKNDRPQTLLMDAAFWKACDQRALLAMGTLWIKQH